MKKMIKHITSKIVLVISLMSISGIALANTGNDSGVYTYGEFFSQSWVWGVIALIIGLVVAAMFVGKSDESNSMINE
jgi:hypothetical protein